MERELNQPEPSGIVECETLVTVLITVPFRYECRAENIDQQEQDCDERVVSMMSSVLNLWPNSNIESQTQTTINP